MQPDGKLLVGGDFHFVNGEMRMHLARLEPDGLLDPSLNLGTGLTGGVRGYSGAPARYLQGLLIQPDGKILLAGGFKEVNGILQSGLARLLSDGQLDPSFRPIVEESVQKGFLRPDGKLIIAGNFSQVNGETRAGLALLNPDGTLDTAFAPVPAYDGELYALEYVGVQPSGKLVAVDGGQRLRRFNTDGSPDLEFSSALKGPALGVTPEGLIVLSGGHNIVRLGLFRMFGIGIKSLPMTSMALGGSKGLPARGLAAGPRKRFGSTKAPASLLGMNLLDP
ncbi:MAG: delta-60 repeat domain-containing protein [Verrucomicrobiales bacterium]|nr:delta-60 repeat domain-containing protein [Verrucomicrobiales bacterium]